jgi:hypothetical protein
MAEIVMVTTALRIRVFFATVITAKLVVPEPPALVRTAVEGRVAAVKPKARTLLKTRAHLFLPQN